MNGHIWHQSCMINLALCQTTKFPRVKNVCHFLVQEVVLEQLATLTRYWLHQCFSTRNPRIPEVTPFIFWIPNFSYKEYYFKCLGSAKWSLTLQRFRDLKKVKNHLVTQWSSSSSDYLERQVQAFYLVAQVWRHKMEWNCWHGHKVQSKPCLCHRFRSELFS